EAKGAGAESLDAKAERLISELNARGIKTLGDLAPAPQVTEQAVEAGGTVSELVERLDGFAKAYPESVFPPPTKEDRDWLHETRPGLQDRIAADMGRHFAQFATEAAEALTRQQALLDEAA